MLGASSVRREHFVEHTLEFLKACARDNDSIASAMSLFRNTEETTTVVFTKFDKEMLSLDLELARLKYGVHQLRKLGDSEALKANSGLLTT